jgi:4-carboxymuconolactone decarboxylase
MTENEPSGAQKMFGEFAPKLAQLTDDVLFGDVWERPELSPRDRSLVTITALVAGGNSEQLGYHISLGRKNGLTEGEIKEAIIHLAFYTGWPKAITAIMIAKDTFTD